MSKTRYTIETLASGQPRPYADTIHRVRVTFEWNGWKSPSDPLVLNPISQDAARRTLERLGVGFTQKVRQDVAWYETYLVYLKPIDPITADKVIEHGDPKQICAAIWEFETWSPYTD